MADGCNNNTDNSWSITGAWVQGSIPSVSKWKKAVFKRTVLDYIKIKKKKSTREKRNLE